MVNAFLATLASSLAAGGSESEVFLSNITTLTGETVTTANFSIWGRGVITIDPLSSSNIEFDSFTAVDSSGIGFTGLIRGLSSNGNSIVAANVKYHPPGTQVIISFGIHNVLDIKAYIDSAISGSLGTASDTTAGSTKITQNLGVSPRAIAALVSQQVNPNMTLKVNPFSIATLDQNVAFAGGNTPSFVAPVSNPRIDLVVYSTTSGTIVIRTGSEAISPATPSPVSGDIVLAAVYNKVGETSIKEQNDTVNGYVYSWYLPAIFNSNTVPAGTVIESAARSTPVGYLPADGSAVSRTTYPSLLAAICPSQTFTVTIASPAVVTANAHGLSAGDKIHFTTTGGLPSGMAANTDYYVIASGLTTNAFEFALSPSGSAVNTTGTQSGIQTLYKSAYGKGDGSTTFNVPDRRSRVALGIGSSAPNTTLSFEPSAVDATNNWVTIINNSFPAQGQAITLTSTGTLPGGLVTATTYYVVRLTTTTFGFATTLALANALTLIDLSSTGTGVITTIFANALYANLGIVGGEETHGLAGAELGDHDHTIQLYTTGGGAPANGAQQPAGSTGAGTHPGLGSPSMVSPKNGVHNNLQPFIGQNFYIKY